MDSLEEPLGSLSAMVTLRTDRQWKSLNVPLQGFKELWIQVQETCL